MIHRDERHAGHAAVGVAGRIPGQGPAPARRHGLGGRRRDRARLGRVGVSRLQRAPLGQHAAQRRLGVAGQPGRPDLGRRAADVPGRLRPASCARAWFTRRKRWSDPKKANPIGASRSRASSSAESSVSRPGARGLGTDMPVLTPNTPHPCQRASWKSPFLLTADTRRLASTTVARSPPPTTAGNHVAGRGPLPSPGGRHRRPPGTAPGRGLAGPAPGSLAPEGGTGIAGRSGEHCPRPAGRQPAGASGRAAGSGRRPGARRWRVGRSGGSCSAQTSWASGQRVRNRQPDGGLGGRRQLAVDPGGLRRLPAAAGSATGTASISPRVYGCGGRAYDRSAGPDLDQLAQVHHADPVGQVAHHGQVVRDEQVASGRARAAGRASG